MEREKDDNRNSLRGKLAQNQGHPIQEQQTDSFPIQFISYKTNKTGDTWKSKSGIISTINFIWIGW